MPQRKSLKKSQKGGGLLDVFSNQNNTKIKKDNKILKNKIRDLEKIISNIRNEKLKDQIIILKKDKENEKLKIQIKNLEKEKGKNLKKINKCSNRRNSILS